MKQGLYTDPSLLLKASEALLNAQRAQAGIGTQKEKSVHGLVKYMLEPDDRFHEQPVGPYVADICNGERIYEIQTGNCYPLIKKLRAYKGVYPVTVVKPLSVKNTIRWMDPATGMLDEKPGHGKRGKMTDLLSDAKNLLEFLPEKDFSVLVLLMETEEYRVRDGYGEKGKSRATKLDRIPVAITESYLFESPEDWAMLFPEEIEGPFTVPELAKALHLSQFHAYRAMKVFELSGCVRAAGKRGKAAMYEPVAKRS